MAPYIVTVLFVWSFLVSCYGRTQDLLYLQGSKLTATNAKYKISIPINAHHLVVEEPCVPNAYEFEILYRPKELPTSPIHSGSLDIVLAVSKEPVSVINDTIQRLLNITSVQSRAPRIIIVSKRFVTADTLFAGTGAHICISQSNIGREGLSYLTYIYAFYQDLPRHILFLQSAPNKFGDVLKRLHTSFHGDTGMLGLAYIYECDCDSTHAMIGRMVRARELWGVFRQSFCPHSWTGMLNGQFLVSRSRIQANPLEKYTFLYYYLTRNASHWIQTDLQHATAKFFNYHQHRATIP